MDSFLLAVFQSLPTPVIVCEREAPHRVLVANAGARLLMNPLPVAENLIENVETNCLEDVFRFARQDQYEGLLKTLDEMGNVSDYQMTLLNDQGMFVQVSVTGNAVERSGIRYMVLYLRMDISAGGGARDIGALVSTAFHLANQSGDVDEAINGVLAHAAGCVEASRVYIVEETSRDLASNTYEWCMPGVAPEMHHRQNLSKEDYGYDEILQNEKYIVEDVHRLPATDRGRLEAQGVKSLAILPLVHAVQPLGYIGFEDCKHFRKWSRQEIGLMMSMASIIVFLLIRRNSERLLSRSIAVLQTTTDNIQNIVFVSDIQTNEIVFLNKTLADVVGCPAETLLGQKCWQVLQRGKEGPCEFCPVPMMIKNGYAESGDIYTWEFQNTKNRKWYLLRDAIIKWIDGRDVHIETATEITQWKEYEEQLKQSASIDSLTGVYNREWGHQLMKEVVEHPGARKKEISLVFTDLDDLKHINDAYGHDVGDRMLRDLAELFRTNIRRSDIICRWGGDEFVILLKCGIVVAEKIMRSMEEKLGKINQMRGEALGLAFSYGIAEPGEDADITVDTLVSRADRQMYKNKMAKGKRTK